MTTPQPRDHIEALLDSIREPPRSLRVPPPLPPTAARLPPGASPPPTDPETFTHAAHGVTASTPRHAVARCRWCGAPFVLIYNTHWLCSTEACARQQLRHAMFSVRAPTPGRSPWHYIPLPAQVDIETVAMAKWKHSLIAGAAGTSKSHGSRYLIYRLCKRIAGLRVLLLRASFDQLLKTHLQYMDSEAPEVGGIWTGGNVRQMRFPHPNGPDSIMFCGYVDHEKDVAQHVGPEWDVLIADEAVALLPIAISTLISRARGSATSMEAKARLGMPTRWARTIMNSNPGGRAMMFLVSHYIRKDPDRERFPHYRPEQFGSMSSTLDDNPYLQEDYEASSLSHLEASRYRQLRHGDWTAIAGQFFNVTDNHIVG